jgi:hypothetical protein
LVYHLATKATEEWKAAQLVRDIRRKEEAEDEIDSAMDMLELTRAQAKLRSAQWSLERVCSRIYGRVTELEHPEKITITLNIGTSSGDEPTVINAEPQERTSNGVRTESELFLLTRLAEKGKAHP